MSKDIIKEFEKELIKNGISRREAIKVLGLGTALFLGAQESHAKTENKSNGKNVKIVIVGGGLSGISTAARLKHNLSNCKITILEPNSKSVSYQPGNSFVASGIYKKSDVIYNTNNFIPEGVFLKKEKAIDFNPEINKVVLSSGETLIYDFLIIAAGVTLDFSKIKGLEEVKEKYTLENGQKSLEFLRKANISSVYNTDFAELTWELMQKSIKKAKEGKKINAIFTDSNTPIKCGGAPKKIMYLMNSRLNEINKKTRENVDLSFFANSSKLFGVKEYAQAIKKQFEQRNFNYNLRHNLKEINIKEKIAIFDKKWEEKGEYDKDLEEYTLTTKHERIKVPYDFLHLTPPMRAAPEIANSAVGSSKGWVPVKKETLQHVKYKNIFSLGDIAAVPLGKTGGSVRKQYKVLVDNLISAIEEKELKAEYDGYTVCPLITDIGKVMLAEFDWSKKPTPTFPLDPTQERYLWWILKAYLLKPMTQYLLLSGRA